MDRHYALALSLLLAVSAVAQEGLLDPGLDGDGIVTTSFGSTNGYGNDVALQQDGKILVAGNRGTFGMVIRYLPDGTLDTTFSGNGVAILNVQAYCRANAVVVQPDGRIVVAGFSYALGPLGQFCIWRLMPDGQLDAAFGSSGYRLINMTSNNDEAFDVALQSDGRIVAAGTAQFALGVVRLTADGDPDNTFGGDGSIILSIPNGDITGRSVCVQDDGKLVLAGGYQVTVPSQSNAAMMRLLPNGDPDTSFADNGYLIMTVPGVNTSLLRVKPTASGALLACGSRCGPNYSCLPYLLQVTSDGTPDPAFGNNGELLPALPAFVGGQTFDLVPMANGSIVLTGFVRDTLGTTGTDMLVMRLLSDGSYDASFVPNGWAATDLNEGRSESGNGVVVDATGKYVVAGSAVDTASSKAMVVRYLPELHIGIEELANNTEVLVYPQPLSGSFTFAYTLPDNDAVNILLLDAQGRVVHEWLRGAERATGENTEPLALPANTAPGTYLLRLIATSGSATVQVVVGR